MELMQTNQVLLILLSLLFCSSVCLSQLMCYNCKYEQDNSTDQKNKCQPLPCRDENDARTSLQINGPPFLTDVVPRNESAPRPTPQANTNRSQFACSRSDGKWHGHSIIVRGCTRVYPDKIGCQDVNVTARFIGNFCLCNDTNQDGTPCNGDFEKEVWTTTESSKPSNSSSATTAGVNTTTTIAANIPLPPTQAPNSDVTNTTQVTPTTSPTNPSTQPSSSSRPNTTNYPTPSTSTDFVLNVPKPKNVTTTESNNVTDIPDNGTPETLSTSEISTTEPFTSTSPGTTDGNSTNLTSTPTISTTTPEFLSSMHPGENVTTPRPMNVTSISNTTESASVENSTSHECPTCPPCLLLDQNATSTATPHIGGRTLNPNLTITVDDILDQKPGRTGRQRNHRIRPRVLNSQTTSLVAEDGVTKIKQFVILLALSYFYKV